MDTLYTFWDNITHYKTKSVQFGGAYELSNQDYWALLQRTRGVVAAIVRRISLPASVMLMFINRGLEFLFLVLGGFKFKLDGGFRDAFLAFQADCFWVKRRSKAVEGTSANPTTVTFTLSRIPGWDCC